MKISELKSHREMERERYAGDPAYAAEVDRLAVASAVGAAVVGYRAEHDLTQSAFAQMMGWKQQHVARLERGDITPSLESLQRLARAGVIQVRLEQEETFVEHPLPA